MPWFKIDDGFYDHPKVVETSMGARGLWISAGTYCARHLTDGVITAKQVKRLGGTPAQIRGLVESGLWHKITDDSGAIAYEFHDYLDFNPSANDVQTKREQDRKRQQKHRDKPPSTSGNGNSSRRDSRASHNTPARARPVPDPTNRERGAEHVPEPAVTASPLPESEPDWEKAGWCTRHQGLPDDQVPNCRQCLAAREQAKKDWEASRAGQAAARRKAIDACPVCDQNGMRDSVSGARQRCDHPGPSRKARPGDYLSILRSTPESDDSYIDAEVVDAPDRDITTIIQGTGRQLP
ncbi:hypothetical protein [Corynebacterium glyciniphilum]|uniref:hypothetical protein n=1 Tax=Corynebacterium glyciniphilum TaxID=1404244 RepID=UPI003DA06C90